MTRSNCNRRDFLKVAGAGLGALALARMGPAGQGTQRRPNILFILADDHAAHAIGCYGSRINKTPNLDRLARDGVRFTNCFCTNSICAPSRASILTGLYSHRNGVIDNSRELNPGLPTFPQLLQQAGYETALIGKWHLKSDPAGCDYWNILPGQGAYHNPPMIEMGVRKPHEGYVTDVITDESMRWLTGRGRDKPFLLMCQHKAPHRNWQPDEKHAKLYEDIDVPEPPTFDDDYATRCEAAGHQAMTVEHHLNDNDLKGPPPAGLTGAALKKWKYQRYIKDYLRCIAAIDDNVGRLLGFLDESGLAQNTIVIYTSDQGFFLGDHGWYDKRFMYEESLRMPLLVRWPEQIKPGSVCEDIALNIDFAPTLLDVGGARPAPEMQGVSLQPLWQGRTPADWRTSMYYRYYEYGDEGKGGWHRVRPHYGVRTRRHKLIHFQNGIDAWELYDLEKDPHEVRNIYDDPANADLVRELKAELARLQKRYGDTATSAVVPASQPAP